MLGGASIEDMMNTLHPSRIYEGRFTPDVAELIKSTFSIVIFNMAEEEHTLSICLKTEMQVKETKWMIRHYLR